MDFSQINEVVNKVFISIGTTTGGALLLWTFKVTVTKLLDYAIRKKPIILSDGDREAITEQVAKNVTENVTNNIQTGVVVDIDGQVNRMTQNRLVAVENKSNEFIKATNKLTKLVKRIATVVSDLKSPDPGLRDALRKEVDEFDTADVEPIPMVTKATVNVTKKQQLEPVVPTTNEVL